MSRTTLDPAAIHHDLASLRNPQPALASMIRDYNASRPSGPDELPDVDAEPRSFVQSVQTVLQIKHSGRVENASDQIESLLAVAQTVSADLKARPAAASREGGTEGAGSASG